MPRSLPALVLAAAVGAAVTYYLVAPRTTELDAALPRDAALPERAALAPPRVTRVGERADIYRAAANASGDDVVAVLKTAAALPPSAERSFRLGAVLARYAELDPESAIAAARKAGASTDVVASLYVQWAGTNPAAALAALGAIDDTAAATTIGLALLEPFGGDDYAVRQIAAALPKNAERTFLVGAVAVVAANDPEKALSQALALNTVGLNGIALQRLAAVWAGQDPRAALERAASIAETEVRTGFQGFLFREWAQRDLDAVFDYFRGRSSDEQASLAAAGALRDAARFDPLQTLEVASQLPPQVRSGIEATALNALAQRDLDRALQYLSTLPAGQQQQWVRQSVARIYGRRDADAALVWAQGTGIRDNLVGVLSGIAATDPARAFDVVKTLPPNDRWQAVQIIAMQAPNDGNADPGRMAEQLIANDDPSVRSMVSMVLSSWSSRSPTSAIAWVMSHADRVPPSAFQSLAMNLAINDPAGDDYLAQVPKEARFAWIQGLAQGRAQADPRAAVAWVERFHREPAYASAAAVVAQGLSRLDPPAAAELLAGIDNATTADSQALAMAANNVSSAWARTNPRAAADWLRDLPSSNTDQWQSGGLESVVSTWANGEHSAAQTWTLRLPVGTMRDTALRALLGTSTSSEPDASLLRAFSSDEARQLGLIRAIAHVAQANPDAARSMSQRYLAGQQLQQAEQVIAQAEGERRGVGTMFLSN